MPTIQAECTREMVRAAIFFDLENLVHVERQSADWEKALVVIDSALQVVEERAIGVVKIAICDPGLARQLAIPLSRLGIRTFSHRGGPDGADRALMDRLEHEVPETCQLVVIASGDHIFAGTARRLRLKGKRVEVIARPGLISADLYKAANAYIDLTAINADPAA